MRDALPSAAAQEKIRASGAVGERGTPERPPRGPVMGVPGQGRPPGPDQLSVFQALAWSGSARRASAARPSLGCPDHDAADMVAPHYDEDCPKKRAAEAARRAGMYGAEGGADLGCPCAPMAPEGLVDLEPRELSGKPAADEPVPIYNAPALAPTEASRREAISGSPVYARIRTRPAPPRAAAPKPLPLGLMAMSAGMGETPTTPPAPVPLGPVYPGPFPPPTYQSPGGGLVKTGWSTLTPVSLEPEPAPERLGPGGRRAAVDPAQTQRFRRLAEEAILVVRTTSEAGTATAADRLAARAFQACLQRLASTLGDFGRLVARLRRADEVGRGAELLLDEVAALDAFAACAGDIVDLRKARTG